MANPWEFLEAWVRENVNAAGFNATGVAKQLAAECRRAAVKAGISEAALVKAAGGNLETFMLTELESAANREAGRLAGKKD